MTIGDCRGHLDNLANLGILSATRTSTDVRGQMKKGIVLLGLSLMFCASQLLMAGDPAPIAQQMNQRPLASTKNMGQWDGPVPC